MEAVKVPACGNFNKVWQEWRTLGCQAVFSIVAYPGGFGAVGRSICVICGRIFRPLFINQCNYLYINIF
jgi:hypothetical protein